MLHSLSIATLGPASGCFWLRLVASWSMIKILIVLLRILSSQWGHLLGTILNHNMSKFRYVMCRLLDYLFSELSWRMYLTPYNVSDIADMRNRHNWNKTENPNFWHSLINSRPWFSISNLQIILIVINKSSLISLNLKNSIKKRERVPALLVINRQFPIFSSNIIL